jgi:hypothetical protein
MSNQRLPSATPLISSSPLWRRAPSRDANGRAYFDFMMLIPGLKKKSAAEIEHVIQKVQNSLAAFEHVVVYVDLNTQLNLLWVSFKPVPLISVHMMRAIQHAIPEARVVAGDFNPETLRDRPAGIKLLLDKIKHGVTSTLQIGRSTNR